MAGYQKYSNDQDQGHRNWLSDIAEAKHACRELLELSERAFSNPHQCLDVSLDSTSGEILRRQHSAILNYYDEIAPFASQVYGDEWDRELCQVRVPAKTSTITLDETIPHNHSVDSYITAGVFYRADQQLETVRLEDLGMWEMRTASVRVSAHKQFEGRVSRQINRRVWLPPKAARLVYRTLNSCVENLGFAAEVKEMEIDAEPFYPHSDPPEESAEGDA